METTLKVKLLSNSTWESSCGLVYDTVYHWSSVSVSILDYSKVTVLLSNWVK